MIDHRQRGIEPPTAEELARLLAHDLRTPLNAVRGFADLLLAGAAGPLAADATELLGEIARAGRALEVSVGLAQEVGELRGGWQPARGAADLGCLLHECGFELGRADAQGSALTRVAGDPVVWRRLLATCHAHLQGGSDHAGRARATIEASAQGCLELSMVGTDIIEGWQMSTLREQLIRLLAAGQGALLVSQPPHLPVKLLLPGSGGDVPGHPCARDA